MTPPTVASRDQRWLETLFSMMFYAMCLLRHAAINIYVAQCHPSELQTQRGRHHAYLYNDILSVYSFEVK